MNRATSLVTIYAAPPNVVTDCATAQGTPVLVRMRGLSLYGSDPSVIW